MNKDSFDKALKNKIPNTATDFDLEAVWNALEARRKQPKRRFLIWWLVLTSVLLSGGAAGWWFLYPRTATPSKTESVANRSVQPNSAQTTTPQKAIPAQQLSVGNTPTEKPRSGYSPTANALRAKQTPAAIHPVFSNADFSPHSAFAADDKPKSAIAGVAPPNSPEIFQKQTSQPPAVNPEITQSSKAEIAAYAGPIHTTLKPLPQAEIFLQARSRVIQTPHVTFAEAEKKRKRKKTPNWSLGLHGIYGSNAVNRAGMPDYMQARAQEEETLDMFQLGLDARRKLRGPWFVQAGIQYVQWTDVRRIDRETVSSRLDSNLLLSRIIYPDGSIEEIYDAGIVTVVQTATEERYNRYRHIELPVMVGAAIPVGQRWRIDVSAGLAFGLYSRPSGTATIGTATKTLNTLGYRNAGAISGQTQLAWMYNNPNWSAGLLLTGRSGLTQSTRTNAAFTEKRHALGLGIVLRRTIR